jgi:MFS family permease
VKAKWLVLFLIWLMMLIAYFDRINLPQASNSIMHDLHLDKAHWGFVLAAFTVGYALMQAPGGFLADRYGSRRLLIIAILGWSVFTALTGFAGSLISLLAIRFVFGIGEGLENGAQFRLVGEYFNNKERALANAIFLSALALGPAIGTPLATWQVVQFGWRNMFFIFGVLGLAVAIVLAFWLPKDHGSTLASEPNVSTGEAISLQSLFQGAAPKLCALGYLLFNMAFWGFLSWIPNYLRDDRHLTLAKSGVLGSLPYLFGVIGMALAGYLGSNAMNRYRPLLIAICCGCAAGGLFAAATAPSVQLAVGGLCFSGFFLYGVFGPFWAIAIGLAPSHARGAFTGSVNFCGQVGAFSSQIIIGLFANKWHSFTQAILFMTGALVCGAIVMGLLQSKQRPIELTQAS